MKTLDALRTIEASTLAQRGLLTTAQAQRLNIDRTTLSRLTSSGDLEPLRRGIYAHISSLNDPHRELRAAWLQTAPQLFAYERLDSTDTPVIAYASAASVHEIGNLIPSRHTFITQTRKQTRHPDLRFIQTILRKDSTAIVDNMLTTSVKQTIHDLAMSSLDSEHLADIVRDALKSSSVSQIAVHDALQNAAQAYGYTDSKSFVDTLITPPLHELTDLKITVGELRKISEPVIQSLKNSPDLQKQFRKLAAALRHVDSLEDTHDHSTD